MPPFSLFKRLFQRRAPAPECSKDDYISNLLPLPFIPDDIFLEVGKHLSRIELLEFSMLVRSVSFESFLMTVVSVASYVEPAGASSLCYRRAQV